MRAAMLTIAFAAALTGATAAEATARPGTVCPQIRRTPVARVAQLPSSIRKSLGAMADPGGRWNAGDAIGPGETHLPFRRLVAAGAMSQGRWLVVWEQGGIAYFNNVEIYRVTTYGGGRNTATKLVSASGGMLAPLCAQAAAKLRRP